MPAGRPKLYTDEKEFAKKVDEYFVWCDSQIREYTDKKGNNHIVYKPYTVSGLCLYINMTNETLNQYEKDVKFSESIKRAKKRIENWIEEHALTREIDNTSAIFNLKNNFGWKDKQEVESTNHNVNEDITQLSDEQRKARIAELQDKMNK